MTYDERSAAPLATGRTPPAALTLDCDDRTMNKEPGLRTKSSVAASLPVSVVVITRNSEGTIEECLSAVAANRPAEIIVVDGNSTDRTLDIARKYTGAIYRDEGRGKGYARQLGTEKATQEYVAHIDSDVFLADGALSILLDEFRNSGHASMHALGELRPQGNRLSYWERAQAAHSEMSWKLARQKPRLGTASGIFRREILLKYGFESGYGGGLDDIDLEARLKKDGQTLGVSTAKVYFHYRADFGSFFRARFMWGKVASGYIRKHGIWHARFWPPLRTIYWLGVCLVKMKPWLVPYFVLDGVAETAGMVKGFFAPADRNSGSASNGR